MVRSMTIQMNDAALQRARPTLFTPAFITVALAELAYFTADGMLLPALGRYVEGPLGRGNIAIGLVIGAFSVSAFFLRPWAGGVADRRGRRILMVAGASLFAVSVAGTSSRRRSRCWWRCTCSLGRRGLFFVAALAANVDLAPPSAGARRSASPRSPCTSGSGRDRSSGRHLIETLGFDAVWLTAIGFAALAVALACGFRQSARRGRRIRACRGRRRNGARAPPADPPAGLLPGLVLAATIWGMAGFLTFVPLYALDLGMQGAGLVLDCSRASSC